MSALSHSSPAGPWTSAGSAVGYRRTAMTVTNDTLPTGRRSPVRAIGWRWCWHDDEDAPRRLPYTAAAPDRRVELHLPIDLADPVVPSLAALSFPAGRFEREMHDLYGIIPRDHPLPRRLVRHDHWPRGWYPMRRDAGPPPEFGEEQPFPFLTVEGPGVYEIPVGPIHAGLSNRATSGSRWSGDHPKAKGGCGTHWCERLFAGREAPTHPTANGSPDTAVGHTLAYCRAVEDALGLEVPSEGGAWRCCRAGAALQPRRRLGALCNARRPRHSAHARAVDPGVVPGSTRTHRAPAAAGGCGGSSCAAPDADQVAAIAADIAIGGPGAHQQLVAERSPAPRPGRRPPGTRHPRLRGRAAA